MILNNADYSKLATMQTFNFAEVVELLFKCNTKRARLKDIYTIRQDIKITDSLWDISSSRQIGVYALFLDADLLKIGQAADNSSGIFHRMSQYYRESDGKCKHINCNNKDHIRVEYFNLESVEECWAAEKLLQGIAFFMGEEMPWEEKERYKAGERQ
jgi:hypothetical protein